MLPRFPPSLAEQSQIRKEEKASPLVPEVPQGTDIVIAAK